MKSIERTKRHDMLTPISWPRHVALLLLLTLLSSGMTLAVEESSRPNIILIFTDDQGFQDVGCYGSEIPTPAIDSLARDGLKFESWYVASSICTPSRFGLLTGRHPSRSRDRLLGALMFLGKRDADRGLRQGEVIFPARLRDAGYHTALVGKWHLGHGRKEFLPTRHGFHSFFGHTGGCVDFFTMRYGNRPDWYRGEQHVEVTGYATEVITDEAVRFLETRDGDQPFFLKIAYNAPHFGKGWDAGNDRVVNLLQPHPDDLPRVAAVKDYERRQFAAKVVSLDDGVGRVLKTLEKTGLAANTLVIFMTDHGGDPNFGGGNLPLRGSKATLFEGGIRVPCLMRWPGKIRAGTTTDAVTSALDIHPTLCRLAGIDLDGVSLDGRDLSSLLLRGEEPEGLTERELFWELGVQEELGRRAWLAVRHGRWKFLRSPSAGELLFDLEGDPAEAIDLSGRHPEIFERLKRRAHELHREMAAR